MKIIYLILIFITITLMVSAVNPSEYKASNGITYQVGDTVTLGVGSKPSGWFEYIRLYPPGKKYENLSGVGNTWSGLKISIKKIIDNGVVVFQMEPIVWIHFEEALKCGEILGGGMTSDQALTQLKKEKDKLDLNIITQTDYDKKKAELVKYIK